MDENKLARLGAIVEEITKLKADLAAGPVIVTAANERALRKLEENNLCRFVRGADGLLRAFSTEKGEA